ncbi:unnamed protein product [Caenorhabditis angaria]|uniref:Uncharacterized protein n=1 Tax=Caenorhabditis angaria TaxID=860376 RepID=A0A9P1MW38_9PELO|nr:unnamed protein product [Caenorhabditis angaria]
MEHINYSLEAVHIYKTMACAAITLKGIKIVVDISNMNLLLVSAHFDSLEYSIGIFKPYEIRDVENRKYVTIHGNDCNKQKISMMIFEFQENDPQIHQFEKSLDVIFEKSRAFSAGMKRKFSPQKEIIYEPSSLTDQFNNNYNRFCKRMRIEESDSIVVGSFDENSKLET